MYLTSDENLNVDRIILNKYKNNNKDKDSHEKEREKEKAKEKEKKKNKNKEDNKDKEKGRGYENNHEKTKRNSEKGLGNAIKQAWKFINPSCAKNCEDKKIKKIKLKSQT